MFLSHQVRVASGESVVVVVDEDFGAHPEACAYLKWLQHGAGRSPGTARTYGSRVAAYLTWAEQSGIDWRAPALDQMADLVRWLHRGGRGETGITPRSPGYVNLGLTATGGFLRFCALHGWVPTAVADRLSEPRFLQHLPRGFDPGESGSRVVRRSMLRMKVPVKAPRFLTGDQQSAVTAGTRQVRDRFLVEFLFGTGLRVGEACGLHRQDMHFLPDSTALGCQIPGPHLHVVRRENNNNGALAKSGFRRVPVGTLLVRLYADYQQERWEQLGEADDSPFVFVNLYRPPLGAAMRPDAVEELFERLSRDAGIKATPHTCRHTFATRLIRAGVDRDVVQELLGHESPASLAVYTHADWSDLRAAVEAIEHGERRVTAR